MTSGPARVSKLYRDYLPYLDQGYMLVCSHDRLARHLRRRYAEWRALDSEPDAQAWPAPRVHTEISFLKEAYETAALAAPLDRPLPILLSDRQSAVVWGREIQQERLREARENGTAEEVLLGAQGAAHLARQARRVLRRLNQPLWDAGLHYNMDPTAFRAYALRVEKVLADRGWMEMADVPSLLIRLIQDPEFPREALPPVGRIVFVGFVEPWPELRLLAEALEGKFLASPGYEKHPLTRPMGTLEAAPAPDLAGETEHACLWAASHLNAWLKGGCPTPTPPRIGIAVLGSQQRMDRFERVLTHLFDPQGVTLTSPTADYDPRRWPFSLQAPRPLRSYAVVRMAYTLLSLDRNRVTSTQLGDILRSPTLRIAGRQQSRILREEPRLRREWPAVLTWTEATTSLRDRGITHAPRILEEVLQLPGMEDTPRRLSEWAEAWAQILAKVGWPRGAGETLDTGTYQTAVRMQDLLMELGSLDLVLGYLPNRKEALRQLDALLRSTVFQWEGSDGPIEVFDAEESAGLEFDALYICGMVDESWPPVPTANHFLPIQELISAEQGGRAAADCPRATAKGSRTYAQQVTELLLHAAPRVALGLPKSDGQGRALRPSVLLAEGLKQAGTSTIWNPRVSGQDNQEASGPIAQSNPWSTALAETVNSLQGRTEHSPEEALALDETECQKAGGGSGLLQAQSQCPIRALLRHRLDLEPLPEPVLGISAQQLGIAFHQAVELFWTELPKRLKVQPRTQSPRQLLEQIVESSPIPPVTTPAFNELGEELLRNSVKQALSHRLVQTAFAPLPADYQSHVAKQLLDMLRRWVTLEWDTGSIIEALEEKAGYTHGDLHLSLRLDRKDRTDNGVILSDYKGSRKSANASWFGLRAREPQLPLYAQVVKLRGDQVRELRFGIYQGPEPEWISLSANSILKELPRNQWLVAELTAQGILTAQELEAFSLDRKAPGLDRALLFQRYLDSLDATLRTLFDGFLQGELLLDPLPLHGKEGRRRMEDLVCTTCDFQDVCRIREYLRDSAEDAGPESGIAGYAEGGEES